MGGILQSDDQRPLLIVHIGGAKCGSTAIQHLLGGNRQVLLKNGIAVPDTDFAMSDGPANQIWFFQNLVEACTDPAEVSRLVELRIEKIWAMLADKAPVPPRGIILSAENLSNNHNLHEAFAPLKNRFRLCVILYIRCQEEAYHSAWQQWFVKNDWSIDTWLETWSGEACDWSATLDRWESITPDGISVRLFDRSALKQGDIIDDVCEVLGLEPDVLWRPKGNINVSFGVHMSELYHEMTDIFDSNHDHSIEQHFLRFGGAATRKYPNEWLFTREQFALIRSRHLEGNATVKEKYFPDLPRDTLFPEIPATDTFRPDQNEITKRSLGVLGHVAVRQYRDTEARLNDVMEKLAAMKQQTEQRISEMENSIEKEKQVLLSEIEKPKSRKLFRWRLVPSKVIPASVQFRKSKSMLSKLSSSLKKYKSSILRMEDLLNQHSATLADIRQQLGRLSQNKPAQTAPVQIDPAKLQMLRAATYAQDGLLTIHNSDFRKDPDFQRAYARGLKAAHGMEYNWHWRVHVALWAARTTLRLPGDFVECGVNCGFLSSAIMELLDWNKTERTFWLLDTFTGLDLDGISSEKNDPGASERNDHHFKSGLYTKDVESVRRNFAEWPKAKIVVGPVPGTLSEITSEQVAFASIDMNSAPPEIEAMEFLWPRMVSGGMIVLDDYTYGDNFQQNQDTDSFAARQGVTVLALPTGQGIIVKP